MKRRNLGIFALALIATVSTTGFANELIKRANVNNLYVQDGASCIKVAATLVTVNPIFQKGITGTQAYIQSTAGAHLLWEDANCNTTPVYFN